MRSNWARDMRAAAVGTITGGRVNAFVKLMAAAALAISMLLSVIASALAQNAPAPAQADTRPAPSLTLALATVKEFYRWYIHSLEQDRDPLEDDKKTLRGYVTEDLLRRLEASTEVDVDYFIQAQDYFDDWESSISTAAVEHGKTTATIVVTFGTTTETRHKVGVMLTLDAGTWKIDRVQSMD
jgi:hypothetical protein